jgi:hypothetical protein
MSQKYVDERIERLNGQVSFFFLMITQVAMGGIIFFKRYVLGLPTSANSELLWLLALSAGGYWTSRLYFDGSLPVISLRNTILIYLGLVALVCVPTYLIHGLPIPERWYEVLYPFIGVGIALAVYSLLAYFGKRRLEKMISS